MKIKKGDYELSWMQTGQWTLKSNRRDVGKISGGDSFAIKEVKNIIDLFQAYLTVEKSNYKEGK